MGEGSPARRDMSSQMNTTRARQLRKNSADAERALWKRLRNKQLLGCKFKRQAPIGRYIADFACFSRNLIVELDGGQHLAQEEYDAERSEWLRSQGFRVLRFWNNDALADTDSVLERIMLELGEESQAR